jgi:ribosomal protein L35AE/L33A
MIPNAIFQQDDGMKINQLTIHQIHGNAKGVVVVNVNDALPFSSSMTQSAPKA